MTSKPLVSVLMTIYNHRCYLEQSVESIRKQTYKNWELVAIDNGSTDGSEKILSKLRHKNIRSFFLKKNIGRTNCLNFGLNKCKGEYIAILDSDDISHKDRLILQINEFKKDKNLWLLATNFKFIGKNGKLIKDKTLIKKQSNFNLRKLLINNLFAHSSIMYKKLLIKKIGKYPKKFKYAQDYAFFLKAYKKFKIRYLNKKLVKIRAPHKDSETGRNLNSSIQIIEKIKLLVWSGLNINTSLYEKYLIGKKIILECVKFFLPKEFIILKSKILEKSIFAN